ncbi:hypothetical protein RB195_023465 [Necator americanus]|uniref:Reverse transcriptase domain-containing protein n=1 Tax=Necator americanus TaxID=51031 RepID=A0ABR1EJB0_NECAM
MRKLEWDDMGVKVDGRKLHHLRFADDIVLITTNTSQAGRMLTEFDETCGCIGSGESAKDYVHAQRMGLGCPTLNETNIFECTSYVYLGLELNMMNDLIPKLGRRRRAVWGAYKSIEDVVKKTRNTLLRAHLFNTTGRLWHAIGTNERITGTRSTSSKINGSQGVVKVKCRPH